MAVLLLLIEGLVTEVAVRVTPALRTLGAVQLVLAPVSVVAGLKVPQGAGEQLQVTPAVSVVVALTVPVTLLVATEAGTVPTVTVMRAGGVVWLLLLHATSAATMHRPIMRRMDLGNVIVHLRLIQVGQSLWF